MRDLKYPIKSLFTLVLFLLVHFVFAQYENWKYMPKGFYPSAIEEEGDHIWISDYSGLVKINKLTKRKTYINKSNSPLPDNWVYNMVIDRKGYKWLLVSGTGLVRFKGEEWTIYDTLNSPISSNVGREIAIDNKDRLWIADNGLRVYEGNEWTVYSDTTYPLLKGIYNLTPIGDDIWYSSGSSVFRFDGYNVQEFNVSNSNISDQVFEMEVDKIGRLWVFEGRGVKIFNGIDFDLALDFGGYVKIESAAFDSENRLWAVFAQRGWWNPLGAIFSWRAGDSVMVYDTTNSNQTLFDGTLIFVDSEDGVWATGLGSGSTPNYRSPAGVWSEQELGFLPFQNNHITDIGFGLNNEVFFKCTDWGATNPGDGILKYHNGVSTKIADLDHTIHATCFTPVGEVILKFDDSLQIYSNGSWRSQRIPYPNFSSPPPFNFNLEELVVDNDGTIWIDYLENIEGHPNGGPWFIEGVSYYKNGTWTSTSYLNSKLPKGEITNLAYDELNRIWCEAGGSSYLFENDDWTKIDQTSTESILTPNILVDNDGSVFRSDGHYGLNKWDGINWTNIPHPHYSGSNGDAPTLIDNENRVWMTFFNIIYTYKDYKWDSFAPTNAPFSIRDNILTIEQDSKGNIWMGSNNGVYIYNPSGISEDVCAPKKEELIVFPNPVSDYVTFDLLKERKVVRVSIYNYSGQLIFMNNYQDIDALKIKSMFELTSGIYIYRIDADGELYTGKFIVL